MSRLRFVISALLITGAAATGCRSTPLGVEALAGRYELRSVNGRAVPVDALGGALRGELVLSDNGRARRVVQYARSGLPGPAVSRANGSYRVRGNEITLDLSAEPHGSLPDRVSRLRGEIASSRIVLRYARAGTIETEELYVRIP